MSTPSIESRGRLALGVWIVTVLGLLCIASAVVAAAVSGAHSWIAVIALTVVVVLVALFVTLVHLPARHDREALARVADELHRLEDELQARLRRVEAGDLVVTSASAETVSPRVAAAFRAAAEAIAALVQQIQNASLDVAAAGGAVHANAADLASGSSQQAAGVVEITATTEELARTAAQIATNASAQARRAEEAEAAGANGAAAVGEATAGVEAVRARITAIATRADTLGARAREIYKVLDLINEIAQETHILSLNAAIEAAAAGEHGRRFSVVAEEVRRLAQRARESVDSVRVLLDEFSASIRATVVATEEGSKEATRVMERSRAASAAIEELRRALGDTARAAREISLATEQQRTASDQVVVTLKEVSQVIQRMAAGLKGFSATAENLNRLALSIQLLTQSFHIDSPRSLKHLGHRWGDELGRRSAHWEAAEAHLEALLKENGFLELAYLVDASGTMIAFAASPERSAAPPANVSVGTNFADRPWFQAVLRDRRAILTPLYDSLLTGEPCFTVAVPVWRDGSELAAVLGLDVNVRSWTRI
jgi:methyl-accepting chemotaxis protein